MKKSLFAVAAVTAFAGAAQAQSSVTVYGIMDVGFTGTVANTPTSVTASTQTTSAGFVGAGQEQTSRLGFKGTEDLGGGMSAFFTIEANLIPESEYGSLVRNRQQFVGVKKNGLGAASVGLQYTPIFNLAAATNPGQYNGTIGDLVYVANNAFANTTAATLTTALTAQNAAAANSIGATGFTNNSQNALFVKSDNFAGITAQGFYARSAVTSSSSSNTTAQTTNATVWGLGADYTWKQLYASTAYQVVTNDTSSPLAAAQGVSGTTTTNGGIATTNMNDKQFYAGATYDFGILKAYLQYSNRQTVAMQDANQTWKRTAQQVGVRSYITPVVESWASVGNGSVNTSITQAGVASQKINIFGYQLGSNYYLSKRTNLYAIYGTMTASLAPTYVTGSGANAKQYAVGLRHTF
jgi:predicted porin